MGTVMKASEFVEKLKDIANNYKTLYVMGCFGSPLNAKNKTRYCNNHRYNEQPRRTAMIKAATTDTFGFDCVNLIKGILWGWSGDVTKTYGGAKYNKNGVPDVSADGMIKLCKTVTSDFSKIEVGEAVWCKGHIGVYIGDGLAIESTPAWKNRVQITAVRNIGPKSGYNSRTWTKHGKLPYIDYDIVETPPAEPEPVDAHVQFIKDIQRVFGATVDGIAGPKTLAKTKTLSAKTNRKHAAIKIVQKRLKELGYTEIGAVDGVAGPKFTSAVAHFQQDNDCEIDGEITAKCKTWKKLLGMV